MYQHDFTSTTLGVNDAWRAFAMGVAQIWSAKDDIDQFVDFEALRFPASARDEILMQLQTLAAFGLDIFGGVPLYTSNKGDALPRSTDVETFDFIEINGTYGAYKLEEDWREIFGFNNERSTEIIWSIPSANARSERSVGVHAYHYGMGEYWDNGEIGNRNNGYCLVPSLDVNGKSYLPGSANPSPNETMKPRTNPPKPFPDIRAGHG